MDQSRSRLWGDALTLRNCRWRTILLVALTGMAAAGACNRDPFPGTKNGIPVTDLLQRTSAKQWEIRRSVPGGVELEVPTDLCGYADDAKLGMVIEMHAVPPPRGVLDDKRCLLEIKVQRFTRDDFERLRAIDPIDVRQTDPDYELRRWQYRRHGAISRYDVDHRFTYYRYDVDCSNGDVISTIASVVNVHDRGAALYVKEDEGIIRRVLGSVRCLPPQRATK